MTRDEVFDVLVAKEVVRAEVSFSGGHDEGGCDDVLLLAADGRVVQELREAWPETVYDQASGRHIEKPIPDGDAALAHALCRPVYNRYGGFAGEYCVSGTVVWDAAARTVTIGGKESVEQYESFEETLRDDPVNGGS